MAGDRGHGASSPGGGAPARAGGGDRIAIAINNTEYQADKPSLTGSELKRLAKEPPIRAVIWNKKGPAVEQGEDDEAIPDDQSVNLSTGMTFRIVNAGTFG